MQYFHDLVTQKSFELLKQLQRQFDFVLIGGWAVYLLTQNLKSKDIDLVVDYPELERMRKIYDLTKNDRLKKYEIKQDEIDIDIYVYHYSNPGLPAAEVAKFSIPTEGFKIPRPEVLLILKLRAFRARRGSPKGEKDKIDILSLLGLENFNLDFYKDALLQYGLTDYLSSLKQLVAQTQDVKELGLDRHKFSRFKKKILKMLE